MKHLLTSVAVVAALAFSAPAWTQPASPSGGNPMGMPGPNPGGPGLTPYTTGQPSPPMAESTSAMPPKHHGKTAAHHRGKAPQLTGDTANQLNQEELARLQSGNFSNPPVVPSNPLPPSPAPTSGGRMSGGGRATSASPR
jgi:hypothetical protein